VERSEERGKSGEEWGKSEEGRGMRGRETKWL
jgi:hypothetical protein